MNFSVVNTDKAEEDILRNATWWADHHSTSQAVIWIKAIREQVKSLAHMPDRFSLAPENGLFSYDIRQMPLGLGSQPAYRAIDTIVEDKVFVLTVRVAEQAPLQSEDLPDSADELQ